MISYPFYPLLERTNLNPEGKWIANPLLFSGKKESCSATPEQAANLYRRSSVKPKNCEAFVSSVSVKESINGFKKQFPQFACLSK